MDEQRGLTLEQYTTLMKPLNGTRVQKRSQSGKQLSYVATWDVKAHLTRVFGFGNWDSEMLEYHFVTERLYQSENDKDMVEVIYNARMQLTIRDQYGNPLCCHSEGAAGSASGPYSMLGEHHDNALKNSASDALKRCAINLGTQFGLSLYDNGNTKDVIKGTLIAPEGYEKPKPTEEQEQMLKDSLGAEEVKEGE